MKLRRALISFRICLAICRSVSLRLERGEEGQGLLDRLRRRVVDADPADRHREGLGPEPLAVASLAVPLAHEALQPLLDALALRLEVAPLEVGEDARKRDSYSNLPVPSRFSYLTLTVSSVP